MKAVKWLDEHAEETILVVLLALISIIELMQVVCRNVDFIPSLTWAEETCRFLWIGTVFISLPYTVRTETMLRVTALVDILPWKLHNIMNIIVDLVVAAALAFLGYYAIDAMTGVLTSGELSSATRFPMWILYLIIVIGFFAGALRSLQMFVIHIKNINVPPLSATEADAAFELSAASVDQDEISSKTAAAEAGKNIVENQTSEEKEGVDELINRVWTNNGNPTPEEASEIVSSEKGDK